MLPMNRFSAQELFSIIALLMMAGREMTIGLISNAVPTLLRRPDPLATPRSDPALTSAAISKGLRCEGPVERPIVAAPAPEFQKKRKAAWRLQKRQAACSDQPMAEKTGHASPSTRLSNASDFNAAPISSPSSGVLSIPHAP